MKNMRTRPRAGKAAARQRLFKGSGLALLFRDKPVSFPAAVVATMHVLTNNLKQVIGYFTVMHFQVENPLK